MAAKSRIERDSMGEVEIPGEALWGAQTQRAVENFPVSDLRMPRPFIRALGLIKASAAAVNARLGLLDDNVARAVIAAGLHDDQFTIDEFQTGFATSSNDTIPTAIHVIGNDAAREYTNLNRAELERYLDPIRLTRGGLPGEGAGDV